MLARKDQMKFYNVGLSYRKAEAHIRSKFSLSEENQLALLREAKAEGLYGVFVISTCNRTEISGFVHRPCRLVELLCKHSSGSVDEFYKYANITKAEDAIDHLFRMGTGLDSQILGDYEIVGQLRKAFKQAKNEGITDAYSERLVNNVLQASKRVKNETMLSSGTTSVSYAGVQYILNNVLDYDKKNILTFGLGKMGKYTCKNLNEYTKNSNVSLVNRTDSKVDEFIQENPQIRKVAYGNLVEEISKTDILIVSTGASKATITKDLLVKYRELLVLDLSIPSNVDPEVGEMPNVTLVNVDELSKVTDKTLEMRINEIPKAEKIITEHQDEFFEWARHRKFIPAISALKSSLEEIKRNEINFHKKKIQNFDESQAEAITTRMIQKITTQFMKHLKNDDTSTDTSIDVMSKVFENAINNN